VRRRPSNRRTKAWSSRRSNVSISAVVSLLGSHGFEQPPAILPLPQRPPHLAWSPKEDSPRGCGGDRAPRLPGLITDLTFVTVDGGPHNIAWTHADEVDSALLDFVAKR